MIQAFLLLVGAVILAVATYTDVRERVIPDWLNYSVIAVFLPVSTYFYGLNALLVVLTTFFFAYCLYRIGVWAGGDVKLFTALSAVCPCSFSVLGHNVPYILLLFVVSVLFGLIFTGIVLLRRVFSDEFLRRRFCTGVWTSLRKSFALSVFYVLFGLPGVLATFLPQPLDIFSALVFLPYLPVRVVIQEFAYLFLASLLFLVLAFRSDAFVREVPVDSVREGDIPADFYLSDGRVVRFSWKDALLLFSSSNVRISPLRAAGLYPEDVEWLRSAGFDSIRVKYSLPFVPFVLLGHLFIVLMLYF